MPDHVIVLGEAHLRHVLKTCAAYYNEIRTQLALSKDAHYFRPGQRARHCSAGHRTQCARAALAATSVGTAATTT